VDFKDDVESSLMLLGYWDTYVETHGKTWFRRNVLELTTESAQEMILGRSGRRSQVDCDRISAYQIFAGIESKAKFGEAIT
jgi:hypothetical protein